MNDAWIDLIGWVGVVAYLAAYAAVSTKKMEGDALPYQLLNLAGGVLLTINSLYYRAYPSVGVNAAWIGIAVFALARKKSGKKG